MEFVPNVAEAYESLFTPGFSRYSRAYVITNEDLRYSMGFMPEKTDRALVVAGSGDHPLFASLYGAKHVDTFDISYNAKCITDIKVAALQGGLDLFDYEQMIYNLYFCRDIQNLNNIDKISPRLSKVEYDYLCAMKKISLFHQGANPQRYECFLPNAQEYKKLQDIVKEPYNFVFSDIKWLSARLTDTYDLVHVSNIFDRIPRGNSFDVLMSLLKLVNKNGRILLHNQSVSADTYCKAVERISDNWRYIKEKDNLHIMERIR